MKPDERRLAALQEVNKAFGPPQTPTSITAAAHEFDRFLCGETEAQKADENPFEPEQLRRAAALAVGADLLKKGGSLFGGGGGVDAERDVTDLVDLAEYVVDGVHPHDRYGNLEPAVDGEQEFNVGRLARGGIIHGDASGMGPA